MPPAAAPTRTLRLGAGAGYSGDRIEPAVELAREGRLDYLVFECLAERTVALAQQARRANPEAGFDPLLQARMRAVLPHLGSTRIVSNMGAAHPLAAALATVAVARELGLRGLRVAAVLGDDVLDVVRNSELTLQESGAPVASLGDRIVSANAYLGVAPIVEALQGGAQIVLTGRASDPALFMAPLIHEFGWLMDDWQRLGQATVVGHLLECAGQITGGYFADPGVKDVPNLARLGFPIGEVNAEGEVVITKLASAGGCVTAATCKEQLCYEVHDPQRYLQPDVVADFSQVEVEQLAADRVRVRGGLGTPATGLLKVSVAYNDGYTGEGQMSYAGPGALARARLALEIVRERLVITGVRSSELRFDLIGVDSLHGSGLSRAAAEPYEVRLRVIGRCDSHADAQRIADEVETLYTNGPAGGGGASKQVREVLAVQSVLLPRERVHTTVQWLES